MLAATLLAVASCSWSNPGHDRFMGTDAAVEDFRDIPAPVRARLRERMRKHDFDDIATISADNIKGAAEYGDLRNMHFGQNKMCGTVERKWKPDHKEMGIVYCEAEHCVIVPTVCGNIAMVTRRTPLAGRPNEGAVGATGGGSAPGVAMGDPGIDYEALPPTGAGSSTNNAPATFAGGSAVSGTTGGSYGSGAYASSVPVLGAGSIGYGGGFIGPAAVTPAVPEPATWASLLGGLALVAGLARRRARG